MEGKLGQPEELAPDIFYHITALRYDREKCDQQDVATSETKNVQADQGWLARDAEDAIISAHCIGATRARKCFESLANAVTFGSRMKA
jgi:hypothetical protein